MPPSMNPRVPHRPLRHRKRLRAKKNAVFWACSAGVSSNLRPNRKQSRFRRLCRFPRLPLSRHPRRSPPCSSPRADQRVKLNVKPISWPGAASAFTQLCASAPLYDAVYSHHTGADPAGASRTAANLACGSAGSFAADRCCSRSAAHTANRRCSSSCSAARCTKGFSHTDGFSHAVLAGVTQPHGSWREIQPLLPQTDFNQHKTPPGPRQVPEASLAFGIPSLRHLNILPSFPSAFATQCIPRCARPLAVE